MILSNGEDFIKAKKILSQFFPTIDFPDLSSLKLSNLKPEIAVAKFLMKKDFSNYDLTVESNPQRVELSFGAVARDLKNHLIITTEKLHEIYKDFLSDEILVLPDGERAKSQEILFKIYDFLHRKGVNKEVRVKILGGGALTDVAGFACSTFKRGVPYEFYPTTLLSQIDAAIGGKTAINYRGTKNLIGTFNFPEKVIIDPLVLITLPDPEYFNGFVEIFKILLLTSNDFEFLKEFSITKDLLYLMNFIIRSVRLKLGIVKKDLYDNDERRILNFGHTFGHVFESAMTYSHGFSVLWGMYNELNFFNSLNLLDDNFFEKVIYLLQKLTNTNIFTLKIKSQFVKLIRDDKKGNSNVVYMPVLKDFGKVDILPICLSDIERFFMENLTF